MVDSLYHDLLLSHYHTPKNYGLFSDFDSEARGSNPLCGDTLTVRIKKQGERIKDISFEGEGCVVSKASASILFEYVKGKTMDEVGVITPPALIELLGVTITPARIKCALLPLETIQRMV